MDEFGDELEELARTTKARAVSLFNAFIAAEDSRPSTAVSAAATRVRLPSLQNAMEIPKIQWKLFGVKKLHVFLRS